jgi:hypothetical protein
MRVASHTEEIWEDVELYTPRELETKATALQKAPPPELPDVDDQRRAQIEQALALPPRTRLAALKGLERGGGLTGQIAQLRADALVMRQLPPLSLASGGELVQRFVDGFAEATKKTVFGFEVPGRMGKVIESMAMLVRAAERAPFEPRVALRALGFVQHELGLYLADRPEGSKRPWAEALKKRLDSAQAELLRMLDEAADPR